VALTEFLRAIFEQADKRAVDIAEAEKAEIAVPDGKNPLAGNDNRCGPKIFYGPANSARQSRGSPRWFAARN